MSKLVSALVLLAAVIWSAVVWGGYWILAAVGTTIDWRWWLSDLPREATMLADWLANFLGTYGQGTTMAVWLMGLALLGIVLVFGRLLAGLLGGGRRV